MTQSKEKANWHLDKKIGISHIISTALIAVTVMSYIQKQNVRIELLEQRLEIEISRSDRMDTDLGRRIEVVRKEGKAERKELMTDIRQQFNRMGSKLDKVIERAR